MVEGPLEARSALVRVLRAGHRGRTGPSGVVLQERMRLGLVTVAAYHGRVADIETAVREAFGLDLPKTPRRVGDAALAFVWSGAARWLAIAETGPDALERTLLDTLGNEAAVTEQSDGRVVLRVSGPSARDVLGTAVAIDLHPRAFRPGDVALTPAFHIPVQLWQVDDRPTYDLAVARSTAATLAAWLVQAAEAYGVDVMAEA